jgi:hypothetical protein
MPRRDPPEGIDLPGANPFGTPFWVVNLFRTERQGFSGTLGGS